jgi:hypothetical protein
VHWQVCFRSQQNPVDLIAFIGTTEVVPFQNCALASVVLLLAQGRG